ncbi:hypothetical protein [Engelhardtia mirabilis]|uniref:Uncharacterized protein n=1 Tax=Engelhardtia mirabilis TaxID=2528011 RepID=A0A518BN21_9BACT|nr:hypothetical protein Pla133_34420 [Planctomycetes bacterium Pla133]QDV02672.1 hypothetical protein Pla86_34410 [Planctomycetes bacterium Pla86]
MADRHRLERIRRRGTAAGLDHGDPEHEARRPDPVALEGAALLPIARASWIAAACFGLLASLAPSCTGSNGAALLTGVPAAAMAAAAWIGGRPGCRRVCMVAATAAAGFVALGTVGALGGIGQLGSERAGAAAFQLAGLVVASLYLIVAWPSWQRFHRASRAARARLALFEEL